MAYDTDDLRIRGKQDVIPPDDVHETHPITPDIAKNVLHARRDIHQILCGEDKRLLVVVGPCSIHDPQSAVEYAQRLQKVRSELSAELHIVMRVYFEKPRTIVGWKGLINDPGLDGSFKINEGLFLARKVLMDINALGVPAGTEYLDLITPQYFSDLISWGAIGARTTESQVHRELASGLSCPVGFKNGTDGTLKIAIDAVHSASKPHHFLSLTKAGRSAIFSTTGNEDGHIILRGGNGQPNYDALSVQRAAEALKAAGCAPRIMVDFSHANSLKQYRRQTVVGEDVANQIAEGDPRIFGVMIESHLNEGQQAVKADKPLAYGVSITDACLGWEDSVVLLHRLADAVRARRVINT